MTSAERLAGGIDGFIDFVGRITAWSSFARALVMGGNVVLRYVFHTGTVWSQELEWHLMAPICMLGLSYAILKDGHVQVDILYGHFPERVKRIVDLVSALLVVAVVGILLKLSIPYVLQSYSIGEGSPDPGGLPHRWILKSMLPFGFLLLLVQSVAALLRAAVRVIDPAAGGQSSMHTV